ncbi:MAG: Acyl-CoA dehydrogenase C-terminal domain-containing protein, partial [Bacteroidota bacterium]|nr:Acyl-CoA dehydrogenase C-terminal domain-containing protein [Bacteroidota bacterium]
TEQYNTSVKKVQEAEEVDFLDFHARRLVEMAANIIMGHLLIIDANTDEEYKKSADLFIRMAKSENDEKESRINIFSKEDLKEFRV